MYTIEIQFKIIAFNHLLHLLETACVNAVLLSLNYDMPEFDICCFLLFRNIYQPYGYIRTDFIYSSLYL